MSADAAGAQTPRRHVVKSNGVVARSLRVAGRRAGGRRDPWAHLQPHRLVPDRQRPRGSSTGSSPTTSADAATARSRTRATSLAEHSADLLGVLDHFGLERAVVMGHSLGAHIGVHFACPPSGSRARSSSWSTEDWTSGPRCSTPIAPSVNRLGGRVPSVEMFLAIVQTLPMSAGRWNRSPGAPLHLRRRAGSRRRCARRSPGTRSRKRSRTCSARGSGFGTIAIAAPTPCCARRTGSSPPTTAS